MHVYVWEGVFKQAALFCLLPRRNRIGLCCRCRGMHLYTKFAFWHSHSSNKWCQWYIQSKQWSICTVTETVSHLHHYTIRLYVHDATVFGTDFMQDSRLGMVYSRSNHKWSGIHYHTMIWHVTGTAIGIKKILEMTLALNRKKNNCDRPWSIAYIWIVLSYEWVRKNNCINVTLCILLCIVMVWYK